MDPHPLAHLDGFGWRYSIGGWVLENITFDIAPGERIGLVGRSGCGKSTLTLALNGLVPHSYAGQMRGQVTIAGRDTASIAVADLAGVVAMVFQGPDDQMSQILVQHEVGSGPANLRLPASEIRARAALAMHRLGIEDLYDRQTDTLSGGEKQKVALAAALALQPRLLVLDEPTTDLDPRSRLDLVDILSGVDDEMAMLVVSHDLETIAPLVQRLIVLDDGAIVADGPIADLLAQPSLLRTHGVAVPQHAALNAALRRRDPTWPMTASLDAIAERLVNAPVRSAAAPSAHHVEPTAIEVSNVSFRYPDSARQALEDVSLSITQGEILAIVGNNGSGKTTLSRLILGLLKPSAGMVTIQGTRVDRLRPDLVGYVYQNPDAMLSQMTVADEVAFTPRLLGRSDWGAASQRMLDRFELAPLAGRFPLALSKGQRQRLAYAAVTSAEPSILIFDEPTTGIDHPGCDQIMRYMDSLRGQGRTVVFITHDLALATHWADRIAILNSGRVAHVGTLADLTRLAPDELTRLRLPLPPVVELARRLGVGGRASTPEGLLSLFGLDCEAPDGAAVCDA